MSNGATGPGADYLNLQAQIADWANRQDWSPQLIASFIAMAEQKFNAELRVDRMIAFYEALIISRCAPLPDDWLEMDLIKIQNQNGADGFLPIRYKSRDEFFNVRDSWTYGYYTIEGRQIYFGGSPDDVEGTITKLAYYAEVPVMAVAGTSWIYQKYPNLYVFASLMHSDLRATGEEQGAANYKQLAEDTIQKLNAVHMRAKASGSRVTRSRVRSFG
jgi:hypothetical protein